MPHCGASTFIHISRVGPREEGKYPTHGTRSKFYLMIVAKNILIPVVFSGFLMVFEALFLFFITTATYFKIGFKTWGFNGFNFRFI